MGTIRLAQFEGSGGDAELCSTLMREYAAHLNAAAGGEHICVASLEREVAGLPGAYAAPAGALLLAFHEGQPAGCVALKPLHLEQPVGEQACEMKRLWVRAAHQGLGAGRALAQAAVDLARERGYTAIYLDTLPASMQAAFHIYTKMGFLPVERYGDNPVLHAADPEHILWLRRELR